MPAGAHCFQAGSLRCTVLSDGYGSNPAFWYFPHADYAQLTGALRRRGASSERVVSPHTCLLIETGREVVLVDAGLGAGSNTAGAIVVRLEMAGIRPREVNTVVFTHAHPDHIGGAVDGRDPLALRSMFPDARYVMAEAEWDFWNSLRPDLRGLQISEDAKPVIRFTAHQCLPALRHQVELIDRETEIIPGVRAIPVPATLRDTLLCS